MLPPAKYPILLALFALIFATLTCAAPVAAGLSRTGLAGRDDTMGLTPGTHPADTRTLKERLDSIADKDAKLKSTNWAGVDVKTKSAAYVPIFGEIDAAMELVAEGDTSPEAQKMREWRKWEVEMKKEFEGVLAGQEYKDDAPTAGTRRRKRRMLV